jgi:hypothetical protein
LNTKELILLFIFVIIVLCTLPTNYIIHGQAPVNDIKITSPDTGQTVPVGNLTMHGTSSDNVNTDCQVYVDWNNLRPFQPASPKGLAGTNDYSNWTFTYTKDYHLITSGSNELNANLFCLDNPNPEANSSINIIGQSPTISDTAAKSDTGTGQYSGDDSDSGQDSREERFKDVVFCVIVEDYSNEDNTGDGNDGDGNDGDGNDGDGNDGDGNDGDGNDGDGNDGDGNDGSGENGDGENRVKIVDENGNGFEDEINAEREKRADQGLPSGDCET